MSFGFTSKSGLRDITAVLVFLYGCASGEVRAQTVDLQTIEVQGSQSAKNGDITNDSAIGNNAPPGSAPALAPSQTIFSTAEPASIVSDKVIQDISPPGSDYNQPLKWTPGFTASNPNGLGDTVGAWRGFASGQYNVTFDGIPFGDLLDQHSANYFPAAFLGAISVDRGPGPASQAGYATFGGTLGLYSKDLSDKFGGSIASSIGSYNTFTTDLTLQSGQLPSGTKFMLGFHHQNTDGELDFGKQHGDFGIIKLEQPLGDTFTATLLSTIGQEYQNAVGFATYQQYQTFGKNFGGLTGNPGWNNFYGYNNVNRQSDLEYIDIKGTLGGVHIDNNAYTYSIWYPELGISGVNVGVDGPDTLTSIKIPNPSGTKSVYNVLGVNPGDVSGYNKIDDTRAFGDSLKLSYDINAGLASGTIRTGMWYQFVKYDRTQDYVDFTTGQTYSSLGNPMNASFKEILAAYVDSFYPFVEYEWKPTENLTITPGYKYELFWREHLATINETTLAQSDYAATYGASLPFLTARYRLNSDMSVYAQASEGMLPPNEAAYYVFNTQANAIQPERTENFQTGIVYKTGRLTADADLYLINAQHFASVTTDLTGATYYHDNGGAQYKGIEGELTYMLVQNWALYVNGTYNSARYTSGVDANNNPHAGMAIGGTPQFTAAAGVIYDDGHFFGSLLTKVTGDSWGTQGSDQVLNPATHAAYSVNYIPTYEETDLVVGYRWTDIEIAGAKRKFEVKVGVNNLLDSRVVTDIEGVPLTNSAATAGLAYEFQPSRLIYGAIKVDF